MTSSTQNNINDINYSIAMQQDILENSQSINNVLTTAKNVRAVFHTHYENMNTGNHGLASLICEILTDNGAIFPAGTEQTTLRGIAISGSMFISDIIAEVEKRFTYGSIRYPYESIHQYLSVKMFKKGTIGKIQLFNLEDKNRHYCNPKCCKPRTKIYLVQK
jgi:hypothetical protein